jgi:UDP-N-acetylmuramyl pentapeptide phosphotransferase/UDP-N-acetylglucosamine-1-phosphate transferase
MFELILSFIVSFLVTYFAIPTIINIAREKKLFDLPGERRSHTIPTPSLGGIAIFAGIMVSVTLCTPYHVFGRLQYILCAFFIMFLIGIKDDIVAMPASKKLLAQLVAATILVFLADIRISSFFGVFNLHAIPDAVSYPFSIFIIIVIINAYNLIDGINGLSGGLGVLISITLGTWFYLVKQPEMVILCAATIGACLAFLKYNFTPADIFMGDTGSLLLGSITSVLALTFVETHHQLNNQPYAFKAAPGVVISIIILPLFDTLRVFTIRIMKGRSPFSPDRSHIHHMLIDAGLSHMQATFALLTTTLVFILAVFSLRHIDSLTLILMIFGMAFLLTLWLRYVVIRRHKRKGISS